MPADNLEIFKKVLFEVPNFKTTLGLIAGTATLFTGIIYLLIEGFADGSLSLIWIPATALILFIIPSLISAETYRFFLKDYPRRWGYFLSLLNQFIIFLFALMIGLADSFLTIWNIIWLGVSLMFISNFMILTLSSGPKFKKIGFLSVLHPLTILYGFHLTLGRQLEISLSSYLTNLTVILVSGGIILSVLKIADYLIGSNVEGVSAFKLTSALLRNKQESLDLGRKVQPKVYSLEIQNSSGLKRIAIPWIHPGPIQGFGGSDVSSQLIKKLNEGEEEGFFLHVPSCHRMDPSGTGTAEKVLDAMEKPERGNASKLISKEYEFCKMYGRKVNGKKLVYLEVEGFDDYESAVFRDLAKNEDAVVVDLHNKDRDHHGEEMNYGTVDAEKIRENFRDFTSEIENLKEKEYRAGTGVNLEGVPVFAMVEEVDDQKTLLLGVEGNGINEELRSVEKEMAEEYDFCLTFSTDSHASLHELAENIGAEEKKIRGCIERAEEDLSEAKIGIATSRAEEMKFLKDDYSGLIYSINILARLLALALFITLLGIAIWLL